MEGVYKIEVPLDFVHRTGRLDSFKVENFAKHD